MQSGQRRKADQYQKRKAQRAADDDLCSDIRQQCLESALDGLSLLRAIRANPALAAVRVLLLTGQSEDEPVLAQAQGHARLGKPFTREQLLGALQALVPR